MSVIYVHDKQFQPFISQEEITARVQEIARTIEKDYAGKIPLFIPVLNGAFMFAADLFKALNLPVEICFIKLASYKGTRSLGRVITSIGLDIDLFGRDVIILEDIIDTGRTMSLFLPQLLHQQPASLKICTLLHKPEATVHPVTIDYRGFIIPDTFVVGYGLDYDGLGRNLNAIYQLAG
ncbi:MAG TPA: hypoxanthine phosphoribosyltransferase [Agriterribacter sp.]|mgnify:CR=1 FL=1|nr:hypoxanthine phosphoribosyltransferase [Agriterribacter sp.]HRQ51793.1 hypoxanthine phosphoribosyltransferase [Agriterribacter sp.]